MILNFENYWEFHFKKDDKERFLHEFPEGMDERNIIAFTDLEDLDLFIDLLSQFRNEVKRMAKEHDMIDVHNHFWSSPYYVEGSEEKPRVLVNMNTCSAYYLIKLKEMEDQNEVQTDKGN